MLCNRCCLYKACQISKWCHSHVSSGDLTNQTALYSNKSFQLTKLADPTLVWGEMHGPEHARSRLRAQTMTSYQVCLINIAVFQESFFFFKKKIIRGTTTEWQYYIQSTGRILGCPILSLPNQVKTPFNFARGHSTRSVGCVFKMMLCFIDCFIWFSHYSSDRITEAS